MASERTTWPCECPRYVHGEPCCLLPRVVPATLTVPHDGTGAVSDDGTRCELPTP